MGLGGVSAGDGEGWRSVTRTGRVSCGCKHPPRQTYSWCSLCGCPMSAGSAGMPGRDREQRARLRRARGIRWSQVLPPRRRCEGNGRFHEVEEVQGQGLQVLVSRGELFRFHPENTGAPNVLREEAQADFCGELLSGALVRKGRWDRSGSGKLGGDYKKVQMEGDGARRDRGIGERATLLSPRTFIHLCMSHNNC